MNSPEDPKPPEEPFDPSPLEPSPASGEISSSQPGEPELPTQTASKPGDADPPSSESAVAIANEPGSTSPAEPVPSTGQAADMPAIRVSALSDMGCVRQNNEDCFGYSAVHGLYVVCDGMGGMASGEIASGGAVAALLEAYAQSKNSGLPVSSRLLQAIRAANTEVWEHARQQTQHKGMGTTLVAAAVDGDKLLIGNVGDSRAYLIEGGHCTQLTVDHSYVNELIRMGTLTVENARTADLKGMQSMITRAIGTATDVQPDLFSVDLRRNSVILLTTDGLTRYLLQDEIPMVLSNSDFDSACRNLIDVAKQRGGADNITCLLLQVSQVSAN